MPERWDCGPGIRRQTASELENDWAYEIFGLVPSDHPVNAACLVREYLYEGDVRTFEQAAAATLGEGVPFFFQGRIYRRPDRDLRWVELNGRLQPASPTHPAQIIGTTADITSRKQAEERERRAAQRARSAAAEASQVQDLLRTGRGICRRAGRSTAR